MKKCNKCKEEKELTEYYKREQSKDGLRGSCKDCFKEYNKKYRENNIENNKEYYKEYQKQRKKNDQIFRLTCNIRSRINISLKKNGYKKNTKTHKILGCSFEDFKQHIESQFEDWMNWDNKGLYNGEFNYGWDIDHIIPLSSATTEEELIKLNHYTNLQPLCSKVNRDIKKDNLNYATE